MVSINHTIRMVKEDLADLLEPESIFGICGEVGHKWRKSLLNPATLIHLFVMQILSGNTACSPQLVQKDISTLFARVCVCSLDNRVDNIDQLVVWSRQQWNALFEGG